MKIVSVAGIVVVLSVAIGVFSSCSSSPDVGSVPTNSEEANSNPEKNKPESMTVHSSERNRAVDNSNSAGSLVVKPSSEKTEWTRSGNPIDTTSFDTAIESAKKTEKAKRDEASKKALAQAYFKRGEALTEAKQYASAIGDYRRALKYDPNQAESKQWIKIIEGIYASMNRTIPSEGEEPAPLEYKKNAE